MFFVISALDGVYLRVCTSPKPSVDCSMCIEGLASMATSALACGRPLTNSIHAFMVM